MCPELSGIYDSAPIQPVARIKENLSIWTKGAWAHFQIQFIEPIPASPASIIDLVAVAPAGTNIPANGTIQKKLIPALQVLQLEFLHLRFEPLDNVEGILWELAGSLRFASRAITARVHRMTRSWDPYLASTTFFILGIDRDINLEVRNPMPYAMPIARFMFFGFKMTLTEHDLTNMSADIKTKLAQGDLQTVREKIGATTWLPAEGR